MQLTDDPETIQQVLHIHRLIRKRIGQRAMRNSLQPLWYRGLSSNQLAAAHGLKRALADDILQGSAHRAHSHLRILGVSPTPPRGGLRLLLHMSRGNDVAFLWFLMEMFYKSENHEVIYEFNEQIIMSAIFWLDLNPTLQELDRVLPLPHASAAVRLKRDQSAERLCLRQQHRKRRQQAQQSRAESLLPKSPYFQKPVLRNPRRQRLLSFHPKLAAALPTPKVDKAHCTVWSRWFGDFRFSEGNRIARTVLNREIDNILSSLQAAKLNASHVESMCTHHKQISSMEQSLHWNLERIKQERRDRLIDVDYNKRKVSRQRALDELDRMTEHYRAQFHKMAVRTRMASTRKRLCADFDDPGFVYLGKNDGDWLDKDQCESSDACMGFKLLESSERLPSSCKDNIPWKSKKMKQQKFRVYEADARLPEKLCQRPSSLMQFLRLGGTEMEKQSEKDKEQRETTSQSQYRSSSNYFDLCSNGQLYKFNYRKLFVDSKDKLLDNQQLRLKAEFIKALDSDVNYLNAVLETTERGSVNELVDRTAKSIFKKGAELFEEVYEEAEAKEAKEPAHRMDFGQDYYDANDNELMKEMLRLALKRVAEDRRFVLPTLPEVHCLPLLLEWISCRYGKRYTQAERKRSFTDASYLMDHLSLILAHGFVRTPSRGNLSPPSTFGTHNQQRPRMKQFWNQYTKHFTASILEVGRVFHDAMQAYQSSQINATYYAYMPAHLKDVAFSHNSPIGKRRKRKDTDKYR